MASQVAPPVVRVSVDGPGGESIAVRGRLGFIVSRLVTLGPDLDVDKCDHGKLIISWGSRDLKVTSERYFPGVLEPG